MGIEIEGLGRRYGARWVLRNLTLTVRPGEITRAKRCGQKYHDEDSDRDPLSDLRKSSGQRQRCNRLAPGLAMRRRLSAGA